MGVTTDECEDKHKENIQNNNDCLICVQINLVHMPIQDDTDKWSTVKTITMIDW